MEIIDGHAEIESVDGFLDETTAIADDYGVTIQTFDARYVADRPHLRRAVDLAARATERGETIADDSGVEILLYAAGRRQIDRALEMGVSTGKCPVVAVVVDLAAHEHDTDPTGTSERPTNAAERKAAQEIEGLLDDEPTLDTLEKRLRSYFDVTDTELAATDGTLSDLIRERVALLVVDR